MATGVIPKGRLAIRLARYGCANRPFYYIVVAGKRKPAKTGFIEQLGSYDPVPNENNEKLVALNLERIRYWMGVGAVPVKPVSKLLGLAGFLPIHPMSYIEAERRRNNLANPEQNGESGDENEDES